MNRPTSNNPEAAPGEERTSKAKGRIVLAVTADISLVLLRGLPAFLVGRGWDVHVVAGPGPRLNELRAVEGVTVHEVSMEREPSPLRDLRALIWWIRKLRTIRPDVVWAGTPKASLLAAISGWLVRTPERVYVVRGLRLETTGGVLRRVLIMLEKLTFALSTRALAVSPSLRSEVLRLGLTAPDKVVVLGRGSSNGVDTQRFYPRVRDEAAESLRRQIGLAHGVPVIGFVGRLTPDKGLELLEAALQRVAGKGIEFQLLVIGGADGDRDNQTMTLEPGRVFVTGHVDDTSSYYQLIDVLCLPTRREGFPNVVLEAGASAVPAVTTDATGAIDSVIDGVTGRVVDKTSAGDLADALADLVGDADLRDVYGKRAREWIVRDFSQETVWERIDAYLSATLSERVGRSRPRRNERKAR